MTQETRKIAVLTGDIVGSTALGPEKLERAMTALAESAEVQADWHGESLRFTRHRGDGWQVVLARPEMELRSALAFRAALRTEGSEFDSYMGIATGEAPVLMSDDLNTKTNPVFVNSGKMLESTKSESDELRISTKKLGGIYAATILADHISQSWTPPQATAMLAMLAPGMNTNYTDLARHLNKSRQAVTKSLKAAGHEPIELALWTIELSGASVD